MLINKQEFYTFRPKSLLTQNSFNQQTKNKY